MKYNPRTYLQDLANEAAQIVATLGEGWSHEGAIIRHESGAVVLLMTQVAVAPENALRINLEGMTTDEIVAAARKVAPVTYWFTEYGSDEEGWQPTYYSEHRSLADAERYCNQVIDSVAGDLRISKVIRQTLAVRTR